MSLEMSDVEDSDVVSHDGINGSDEEAGNISTPKLPTECALCDLVPAEDNLAASATSNSAQGGAPEGSIIVYINGQRGFLTTPEQNIPHKVILELSEDGEESDGDQHLRMSVLEKKNETLENQKETLEEQNEILKKQIKRLMEENQQLKAAQAGCGVEQSKEEEFRSTVCTQQLWQKGFMQEEVKNSVYPFSFQECNDDPRGDIVSIGGKCVVPLEASCNCKHICNVQLTDHSNQGQMRNKHQMFVKSITNGGLKCNSIVPYYKPRGDLNGDGVLIAILGPPCKTDGVPEKSIILKHTVPTNVEADACEAMLLQMAYQRAPGAKYCLLQTTFDNSSMLVNPGVTAEALSFLVENWPQWKTRHKLHTLIAIIPYGGKYKVDEEKAVNEAIRSGMIIVAAAGWDGMGIAFPAKLGAVISVAATCCDGTLAPFSSKGRELDCVGLGTLQFESDFMFGSGISTIEVATDLALLFHHFSRTQSAHIMKHIGTYVVRELLEITAGNVSATGKAVMAIIDLPESQVRRYIAQILHCRDRRAISSDPMHTDACSNTEHWSTKNINKQYQMEHKGFPYLSGKGITIAIIDDITEAFSLHLKDHDVEVHTAENGVKYFSFSGTMMLNGCCTEYVKAKGGHGLQCAAIVANTAPNCTILMIVRNDLDCSEKVALSIVMKSKADILLLSSVTTDTVEPDYLHNISAYLSCGIVLCAAGNEGKRDRTSTICYPARARDVIVIGACDCHNERLPYSSCGRQVDFLCPGQFSVADSSGRGGTCYSASAAAALIALLLEYIDLNLSTVPLVEVWVSTEEESKLQTVPHLARNTHLMRALLSSNKLLLCQRTEHAINEGYGALLIDNLGMLTPDCISQLIADFHTEESWHVPLHRFKARTALSH